MSRHLSAPATPALGLFTPTLPADTVPGQQPSAVATRPAAAMQRGGSPADLPKITKLVLDATAAVYERHIAFATDEQLHAVALWTAHTHVFKAFDATPRLSLRSEEPGSGKSRVLDILRELVPDPLDTVCATPAVLWHSLDTGDPTLLLDEADTVFGINGSANAQKALRSILDAGHRRGAVVPRMVGGAVKRFNVYAPVALAGLGRLPETLHTRSVEIVMKKAARPVEPFRLRTAAVYLSTVKRLLSMWAPLAMPVLSVADIPHDLPVDNRDADVWEPLIQIGDLAGGEWAQRARFACVKMVGSRAKNAEEAALTEAIDAVQSAVWGEQR